LAKRLLTSLTISDHKVRLGEKSIIMGVLNVTPDSFSDGGRYLHPANAIRHALSMVEAGADWIDVGGESSRPGAIGVSAEEEIKRVIPVIRGIRAKAPHLPISIDTTKAVVAEEAVRAGANILNDISGLRFETGLARVARDYRTSLILMHLRGRPETMQCKPFVKSIWRSLEQGLEASVRRALSLGVRRSQLILDPGLGFGKSRRQNYEILAGLGRLNRFRLPILVGTSRKSFVQAAVTGEPVDGSPREEKTIWPVTALSRQKQLRGAEPSSRTRSEAPALSILDVADAAIAAAALLAGAHIVRVHNIRAVLPAARLADALLTAR
jgi:dihydropteroate synthase